METILHLPPLTGAPQAALQARELKKNGGEKFGMKPFHRLDE